MLLDSSCDYQSLNTFASMAQDQLLQFTQKLMPMEHRDPKRQRFHVEEEPVRLSPRSTILRLFACGMDSEVCTSSPYRQPPRHTLDVGVSSLQGHRPYQEDTFALLSTPLLSMVAVYDGHGGAVTSTALRNCLLPALRDALEPLLERGCGVRQVCAALRETFLQVNAILCTGDQNVVTDGSTAAVLILCTVQGRMLALSANAGDSRITLGAVAPMSTTAAATDRTTRNNGSSSGTALPSHSPRHYMQQLSSNSSSDASDCSSQSDFDACPRPDSDSGSDIGKDSSGFLAAAAAPLAAAAPPELFASTSCATRSSPTSFALRLSRDHDLKSNEEEVGRIRAAGGLLVRFQKGGPLRVLSHAGGLNMSRSFGDAAYHGLVIAEPFISVTAIAEPVEFIIVASDGLWTVMEDEEAVAYVHTLFKYQAFHKPTPSEPLAGGCGPASGEPAAAAGFSTQQAAILLQREAARRWAARCPGQQDNTTVAILRFCWPSPQR